MPAGTLTTLVELDAKLAECAAAQHVSDDALREVFTRFQMELPRPAEPDPFSPRYRDEIMELYRRIAGRPYSVRNEIMPLDVERSVRCPFPFSSQSAKTAGLFTMGLGFLLHSIDRPAGARILEFGPGWGNSTIALALLGYDVTAVEIGPDFCELLRRRAEQAGVALTVVNDDFLWAETVTEPFDAVVFFECFHHCSDHRRLLAALDRAVAPGGRIYFAAEPIVANWPMPWGLRGDGESLWAIRSGGWMELGFSEDYFREALRRAGWSVRRHAIPEIGWAAVWDAQRSAECDGADAPPPAGPPAATEMPERQADPEAERLRHELAAVYSSTSWRVTGPLRGLKRLFRR